MCVSLCVCLSPLSGVCLDLSNIITNCSQPSPRLVYFCISDNANTPLFNETKDSSTNIYIPRPHTHTLPPVRFIFWMLGYISLFSMGTGVGVGTESGEWHYIQIRNDSICNIMLVAAVLFIYMHGKADFLLLYQLYERHTQTMCNVCVYLRSK